MHVVKKRPRTASKWAKYMFGCPKWSKAIVGEKLFLTVYGPIWVQFRGVHVGRTTQTGQKGRLVQGPCNTGFLIVIVALAGIQKVGLFGWLDEMDAEDCSAAQAERLPAVPSIPNSARYGIIRGNNVDVGNKNRTIIGFAVFLRTSIILGLKMAFLPSQLSTGIRNV